MKRFTSLEKMEKLLYGSLDPLDAKKIYQLVYSYLATQGLIAVDYFITGIIYRGSDEDGGNEVFQFVTEAVQVFTSTEDMELISKAEIGEEAGYTAFMYLIKGKAIGTQFLYVASNNGDDMLEILIPLP